MGPYCYGYNCCPKPKPIPLPQPIYYPQPKPIPLPQPIYYPQPKPIPLPQPIYYPQPKPKPVQPILPPKIKCDPKPDCYLYDNFNCCYYPPPPLTPEPICYEICGVECVAFGGT